MPSTIRNAAKTLVPDPVLHAVKNRVRDRALCRSFGLPGSDLERYREEVQDVIASLERSHEEWRRSVQGSVRGHPYSFGQLSLGPAQRLYALLRHLRPSTVVETGVCNGISTTVVLQALGHNEAGRLYSIDLPEFSDGTAASDVWEGKKGAVIPAGKEPGWVVPDELRDRWELIIGPSQERLPPLLEKVGSIDFFIHDGEHSYDCMKFEFKQASRALAPGGVLSADDAMWNPAFVEFVRSHRAVSVDLGGGMHACRIS